MAGSSGGEADGADARSAAFDVFLRERWHDLVTSFSYVRRHGLDPQDIAQQAVIVAAARYWSRDFLSPDSLFKYCRVVGTNHAKTLTSDEGPRWLRREIVTADPARAELAPRHDPEAAAVHNVDLARILAAMPPAQVQVLQLVAAGYDYATIARRLDLPSADAAKQMLYRARKTAQQAWRDLHVGLVIPAASRVRTFVSDAGTRASSPAAAALVGSLALSVVAAFTGVPRRGAVTRPEDIRAPSVIARTMPRNLSRAIARPGPAAPAGVAAVARGLGAAPAAESDPDPDGGRQATPVAWPGDRIRVRRLGDDSPGVAQHVLPACKDLPDDDPTSREVDCEPGDDDEYVVNDVPPPPTSPPPTPPPGAS